MALVVGTNSYVDVADTTVYFADTLRSAEWVALGATTQSAALVEAFNYLQRLRWKGTKTGGAAQIPDWPRTGVTNDEGEAIDSGTVPPEIIQAQQEIAIRLAADPSLLDSFQDQTGTNIKRVKADTVEVEFFSPSSGGPLFAWVQALIGQFLAGGNATIGGVATGNDDCSSFTDQNKFGRSEGFA